jgi:IS30 family transposase
MSLYTHLSAKERQQIEFFITNKYSARAVARELNRSHKTISRELKRFKVYSWVAADRQYKELRFGKPGKIAVNEWLQKHIEDRLNGKWSPEQISGRLKYQENDIYVSFKTIYNYVNNDMRLKKLLPNYDRRWIYRNLKAVNERHKTLPSVHDRDDSCERKSWEADLVRFGKNIENITTLFNRKSKLVRLVKNKNGKAETVLGGIKRYAKEIKILTMDRGPEFIMPEWFYDNGIDPYYCDAMSPGQKGGCENTNRRIRRWLPKKTKIELVDQLEIDIIAEEMNNTPRKSLGFRTPAEAYR